MDDTNHTPNPGAEPQAPAAPRPGDLDDLIFRGQDRHISDR